MISACVIYCCREGAGKLSLKKKKKKKNKKKKAAFANTQGINAPTMTDLKLV